MTQPGGGMGAAHNATGVVDEPFIVGVIRSVVDDPETVNAVVMALLAAGYSKDGAST